MGMTGRTRFENISAVRVEDDGTVDYGAAPVRYGETVVPSRVAYIIDGQHSSPSLRAQFEIRDGKPRCVSIHIEADGDGRGIQSGDLATIPSLARLGDEAFAEFAIRVSDDPFNWHIAPHDRAARKAARIDVGTRGDGELKEVAAVYRANLDNRPLEAVEELGFSRRTAARRVQQAREKGYLPLTTQGKRNA